MGSTPAQCHCHHLGMTLKSHPGCSSTWCLRGADNPQLHRDLLAGELWKDNLSIPDLHRTGNALTSRFITCRDTMHTQRTPKMSHPQLSERRDAAVGVIQLCLAGDTQGTSSFPQLQPRLARAQPHLRSKLSAIRQNDVGPGKPPNHHPIQEKRASLLLMEEVTF